MTYTAELFLTGITDCMVIWVSLTGLFRLNTRLPVMMIASSGIFARNIIRGLLFGGAFAGVFGASVHGLRSAAGIEPRIPFPAGFCLGICLAPAGVRALI